MLGSCCRTSSVGVKRAICPTLWIGLMLESIVLVRILRALDTVHMQPMCIVPPSSPTTMLDGELSVQ